MNNSPSSFPSSAMPYAFKSRIMTIEKVVGDLSESKQHTDPSVLQFKLVRRLIPEIARP